MMARALETHAAVTFKEAFVLRDGRWFPAGIEGRIVDKRQQEGERSYGVEVLIEDGDGLQVDGWLVDARESQLELVDANATRSRIVRLDEEAECHGCGQALIVTFERLPFNFARVSHPVECPKCGDVHDNLAVGALGPPRVRSRPT